MKFTKEQLEMWRRIYGATTTRTLMSVEVTIVDRIKEIMGLKKQL